MIESLYAREWARRRLCRGPVGPYMESLAAWLVEQGYSKERARTILRGAAAFGRWLAEEGIAVEDASTHVSSYLRRLDGRPDGTATCVKWLLQILAEHQVLRESRNPATDNSGVWIGSFDEHLQRVANVAAGTRSNYLRFARRFIKARFGDGPPVWSALSAREIAEFVLHEVCRRGAVTATRAFLRFLSSSGNVPPTLVGAVPPIREWKLSSLPRYLRSADIERVLRSVDVNLAAGLRDKAILLVLARLGLRAGEVSQLNLEDIDWQEGRIIVRAGKTHRERCLPLPQEVGAAIVAYLKDARPKSADRALFLKSVAPRHRLSPDAVSGLAKWHLRKAGVRGKPLGAHSLRHSVATELVRAGATFKEVADVLGHQCLATTHLYAKLDLGALSQVALPWPGGAR